MIIRRQMPKRTRLPRGEGRPRIHRTREQKDSRKLRDWVRRRDGLHKSPSVNEALAGKHTSRFVK